MHFLYNKRGQKRRRLAKKWTLLPSPGLVRKSGRNLTMLENKVSLQQQNKIVDAMKMKWPNTYHHQALTKRVKKGGERRTKTQIDLNEQSEIFQNQSVYCYLFVCLFIRSAFFCFADAKRPKVMADNPGLTVGEIAKKLGAAWNVMTDAQKEPYQEQAKAESEKYKDEMAQYMKRGGGAAAAVAEPEDDDEEEEEEEYSDED